MRNGSKLWLIWEVKIRDEVMFSLVTVPYHIGKLNTDKITRYLQVVYGQKEWLYCQHEIVYGQKDSVYYPFDRNHSNPSQKRDFGLNGPKKKGFGPTWLDFQP